MRRIGGSFWTPKTDERLRLLQGEGLSAARIAEQLGTTRNAVLGRQHRLSDMSLTFPSYIRQEKEARARNAARIKKRDRINRTAVARLHREMARGVDRNRAIVRARKAGATLQAIGDAVGVTRERVRQIARDRAPLRRSY
jgi:hypothetical protein